MTADSAPAGHLVRCLGCAESWIFPLSDPLPARCPQCDAEWGPEEIVAKVTMTKRPWEKEPES